MIEIKVERSQEIPYPDLLIKYRMVFGSPEGRVVLSDILERCGMMASSFRRDDKETFFNEGMRNVALMILNFINTDPEVVRTEGQSTED
jgi:hypothetical protein